MTMVERRRQPRLREVPIVHQTMGLLLTLAENAFTSHLSGLLNKAAFEELSNAVFKQAQQQFVIVFTDLSGFKRVNDEHGHAAGDALLKEVGRKLDLFAKASNATSFHFSGDEFGLVFDANAWTEVVRTELPRQLGRVSLPLASGPELQVELYFGSAGPDPDLSLSSLLARADVAATVAKHLRQDVVVEWAAEMEGDPLAEPRRRCDQCGATTRLLVARKKLASHALERCANCAAPFATESVA